MSEFTPLTSALGGMLIGLAAVLTMGLLGRIAGISGMIGGLFPPYSGGAAAADERGWRLAFLAGMIASPLVLLAATGSLPQIEVPVSLPMLAIGGLIAGIGVSYANGCPSGHGVCGMARFSVRSIVATLTFMATTAVTVFLVRHVLGA